MDNALDDIKEKLEEVKRIEKNVKKMVLLIEELHALISE